MIVAKMIIPCCAGKITKNRWKIISFKSLIALFIHKRITTDITAKQMQLVTGTVKSITIIGIPFRKMTLQVISKRSHSVKFKKNNWALNKGTFSSWRRKQGIRSAISGTLKNSSTICNNNSFPRWAVKVIKGSTITWWDLTLRLLQSKPFKI